MQSCKSLCASYISCVIHFKCYILCEQETQEYTKTVVRYCLEALQIWFDAIGFIDEVHLNGKCWCLQIGFFLSLFLIHCFSPPACSKSSDVSPATPSLLCHVPQQGTSEVYIIHYAIYCFVFLKVNYLVDNLQAVKCQGLDLDSLLPDQEMLMKIMVHPLQIQVNM